MVVLSYELKYFTPLTLYRDEAYETVIGNFKTISEIMKILKIQKQLKKSMVIKDNGIF